MSMISEQVKKLRKIADRYEQISEGDFISILQAANIIEDLSTKLDAANEDWVLEQYWVMRAVKQTEICAKKIKQVLKEQECNHEPTTQEISQFLFNTKADFVSVVRNYRHKNVLPFC